MMSLSSDNVSIQDGISTGSNVMMTSHESIHVAYTFAVVKMTFNKNSKVSERSQAHIKCIRQRHFINILFKNKGIVLVFFSINLLLHLYLITFKILSHLSFVISITNLSET